MRTARRRRAASAVWRTRRRSVILGLLIAIAALSVVTGRLFIWPARGMPAHVDAVVMLNGPGDRLGTALNLGWANRASFLVISRGSLFYGHGDVCAPRIPRVTVICFDPSPSTTQGETEFAGHMAAKYHWRSIALVTSTPQDTPARLRMKRCFSGSVYVMTAPIHASEWPYAIAYEWAATINAEVLQRSC